MKQTNQIDTPENRNIIEKNQKITVHQFNRLNGDYGKSMAIDMRIKRAQKLESEKIK